MGNISLLIGGRNFTVACADGEESHIATLGSMIEAKLEGSGGLGSQNESRMLLFAALLLADELHERRERTPVASLPPGLEERVAAIATQLENIASRLEGKTSNA